jgi:hypothetical protein
MTKKTPHGDRLMKAFDVEVKTLLVEMKRDLPKKNYEEGKNIVLNPTVNQLIQTFWIAGATFAANEAKEMIEKALSGKKI